MNLLRTLREHFSAPLAAIAPDPTKLADLLGMIRQAQDPRHGDYQANFAMSLSKAVGAKSPRDFALAFLESLPLDGFLEQPEVAGPGFINLRFKDAWLAEQVRAMATATNFGIRTEATKTFVIDYSGPNVAKPLHVGHLRSTIIGDALARILRFLGHKVIGDNHLGDWGTQFGMLLYGYKHFRNAAAYADDPVRELARLYIEVRKKTKGTIDEDGEVVHSEEEKALLQACRRETAKLHAGDPENLAIWREFQPACMAEVHEIYERLDIHFDTMHGESFYNPMLAAVVADLLAKGIATESQGAIIVQEGKAVSLIRKTDGAYTYTTTDLATIKYRLETYNPDAILYVVDFRQSDHFKMLFATARKWGCTIELAHLSFGSILGTDGKPLKSRDGSVPELQDLLDEAVRRGAQKYEQKLAERLQAGEDVPELDEGEKRELFQNIGIGAVKYADLMQNRNTDYKFDFEKMLATEGNTATYMQYAYVRCRGIFRKAGESEERFRTDPPPLVLGTPHERNLALQLLRFSEAVEAAAAEYLPHFITAYLWDLAKAFSSFFQNCPVLKAETSDVKAGRLFLTDLTARVIRQGLHLLGIKVMERM